MIPKSASHIACYISLRLRLILCFLILTLSFAYAGEYHTPKEKTMGGSDTLACSQCHTMHGTQGGQSMIYGGASTVYPKLLRAASILELCRYCHGVNNPGPVDEAGRIPPQVENNITYASAAGDFQHNNIVNEANRHSIGTDVAVTPPPGYTGIWSNVTSKFSTAFNCLYCHNQHGNDNYRNLRYDPGNAVNDNSASGVRITYGMSGAACPAGPCDVENSDIAGNVPVGLSKFYRANVKFRQRGPEVNNISAWCGKCHTNFHGLSGDANMGGYGSAGVAGAGDSSVSGAPNPWVRHPVGDINIGASNLHTDYSAAGTNLSNNIIKTADYNGTRGDADDQPICLSCHYAHGGGNPGTDQTLNHSSLVKIDAAGNLNIGDTTNYNTATPNMRNVCQQCHNQ